MNLLEFKKYCIERQSANRNYIFIKGLENVPEEGTIVLEEAEAQDVSLIIASDHTIDMCLDLVSYMGLNLEVVNIKTEVKGQISLIQYLVTKYIDTIKFKTSGSINLIQYLLLSYKEYIKTHVNGGINLIQYLLLAFKFKIEHQIKGEVNLIQYYQDFGLELIDIVFNPGVTFTEADSRAISGKLNEHITDSLQFQNLTGQYLSYKDNIKEIENFILLYVTTNNMKISQPITITFNGDITLFQFHYLYEYDDLINEDIDDSTIESLNYIEIN